MDEKLSVPIKCFRLTRSMCAELDRASQQLSLPKAHVMRLAIIAGLPLVMKSVPQIQPQASGGPA